MSLVFVSSSNNISMKRVTNSMFRKINAVILKYCLWILLQTKLKSATKSCPFVIVPYTQSLTKITTKLCALCRGSFPTCVPPTVGRFLFLCEWQTAFDPVCHGLDSLGDDFVIVRLNLCQLWFKTEKNVAINWFSTGTWLKLENRAFREYVPGTACQP